MGVSLSNFRKPCSRISSYVTFVEEGVIRGVVWDRATAAPAGDGAESTGHAPPAELRDWGPLPSALSVEPGSADSVEELAELIGEGLYITRVHYLGVVHPREGVVTGMTRDGTFRIRNGKIAEPLVNLRFTIAVPEPGAGLLVCLGALWLRRRRRVT